MKNSQFGNYIKARRESMKIPQRIVAHALNVDTSTLSKMELGERQITISMIKPLSEVLELNFKELQIKFITDKILLEFKNQPHLKEALQNLLKVL
jgi:transcriptional regulator with XRE-family HTH domain